VSLTLILGGVRSGKSAHAEHLAAMSGREVTYVATADPADESMAERIAMHTERRPQGWHTVEGASLLSAIEQVAPGDTLLIDGIGVYLARRMDELAGWDEPGPAISTIRAEFAELIQRCSARPGLTVIVGEEGGLGLVPTTAAGRTYLDLAGPIMQELAAAADRVDLVVAGRVVPLSARLDATDPMLHVHGDRDDTGVSISAAVSVHPDGPPPDLLQVIAEARVDRYPDTRRATAAVAERFDRSEAEVLLTNGASEAYSLIAQALHPVEPVIVHPTFSGPEAAFAARGVPLRHIAMDPETLALDADAIPDSADLVFLTNPSNPSGSLASAGALEGLIRSGRTLVVDEAFIEFVPDEASSLATRADLEGIIVIRSYTKLWSIPGIRAGCILAPADVITRLGALQSPWSVSVSACASVEWISKEPDLQSKRAEETATARLKLASELATVEGFRVWPSVTNFVLVRVPDGRKLAAALRDRGIGVRSCESFPGLSAGHLRIAVRGEPDDTAVISAFREVNQ